MQRYCAIAITLTLLPLCGDLAAQATASDSYFISATEQASGGSTSSSNYRLTAAFGSGAVPHITLPSAFQLTGGFTATLQTPTTGRPWLTGVLPRFATPRSGATLTLSGTELNRGASPIVTVGGQRATVLSRSRNALTVKLPFQPVPGFQPVSVSDGTSVSTLPDGVGVLPLVYPEDAPAPNRSFDLVFKGSPGDAVFWVVGINPTTPQSFPGFLHGLALNPAAVVVMPGFSILDPGGEFRFRIPAGDYPIGVIYAQALFVTGNPDYAPGAFSNLLRF